VVGRSNQAVKTHGECKSSHVPHVKGVAQMHISTDQARAEGTYVASDFLVGSVWTSKTINE
jgi:hypothetical protein